MDLASGLTISAPTHRLLAFCEEEYAYYDAIEDHDPDRVTPLDVLATVSMNSFVNSAAKVRSVHRGMAAACDPILPTIPVEADLRSFETADVIRLLDAACRVRGVLVPVASKVLHRKRRSLIPMLDSVLIDYYVSTGVRIVRAALEDGTRAADAVRPVLSSFAGDLAGAWDELEPVKASLIDAGYSMTPLRALEVLIWIETETRGYYR